MAFEGAITGEDLLRSTWKDATVLSASSEATGYPKENAIDGNGESQWKAGTNGAHSIVIDSGDDAIDMDYLCLRFSIYNLPTSVKIETSSDNIVYTPTDHNYDGTSFSTMQAAADGTSRVLSVDTSLLIGSTIRLNDGTYDERYLVVGVGSGFVELDRLPKPFNNGTVANVYPGPVILVAIDGTESLRYIKVTVTGTPAHILAVQAFKVEYLFDNDILPLNAYPINRQLNVGNVERTFSGHMIGRMQTGPIKSQFRLQMARLFRDAVAVFEWVTRQNRIGVLLDDGTWWEVMPVGTIDVGRRPSTDAELVTYALQVILQEV
jgi:hypothetical protein